jgi:hypothetical protein
MGRLLLPFTSTIDAGAMEYALMLAHRSQSTLVGSAFLSVSEEKKTAPCLGEREQARDFLELLSTKAQRMHVPLERMELYSHDSVQSIQLLSQELDCDAILLFMREGKGVLLTNEEVRQIISEERFPIFLVRLMTRPPMKTILKNRLAYWFQRIWQKQEEAQVDHQ